MKAFGKSESDESKALNRQGVGLGLLISNIIAQSLNTNGVGIRLESNYGQGSTFYFDISVDGNEESSLKRCNSINLNSIIDEEKSESKRSVNMNSWIVPQADQI